MAKPNKKLAAIMFTDIVGYSKLTGDEQNLALELLNLENKGYKALFLQGGATQQFSMVPMNMASQDTVDYLITGAWSKKAADYASYYCKLNIVADSSKNNFTDVSDPKNWNLSEKASYFYFLLLYT